MALALLAALLSAAAASSAGNARKTDVVQQLLTQTEKVRMLRGKQQPEPQPQLARLERRVQLSGDEREIMTKQIMQAISGMQVGEDAASDNMFGASEALPDSDSSRLT